MEESKNISILIADDHAITRDGLKTMLKVNDDLRLVGEAVNGREAVELCNELCPDVVLMDLDMPVQNGVSAIDDIMRNNPDTKIIALSSFVDSKLIKNAIKAGARSYIIKNISPRELAQHIRDTHNGQSFFSPEAMESMAQDIRSPSGGISLLTEKEKDILIMIAKGHSNKSIARQLFVSGNTIKFHISNILSKLGVSNRAQAAAIAVRENLLD
jgi:two-component system, NarL family, response regulator LiaR